MNLRTSFLLTLLVVSGMGCRPAANPAAPKMPDLTLAEARRGFHTHLERREKAGVPVEEPPAELFRVVRYPSPAGELPAYLSVRPADDARHPLIIWLVGGFSNSIGSVAWDEAPAENDQSASAFRKVGIPMLYPSLRGGNENPGWPERFYGEVDDVLAAAEFAAKLDFVDPDRIYLGGHSTGGTLALLAAEMGAKFRAVFAFGPIDDPVNYDEKLLTFDLAQDRERSLRAPIEWLRDIKVPTFVFEGTRKGNLESLRALQKAPHPANVSFYEVDSATHFSLLAPVTALVAEKIVADTSAHSNISFTHAELVRAVTADSAAR